MKPIKKIGFRADANEHIASGHIMRCMSIASQCRKLGAECVFILAENKETYMIENNGFSYHILNSKWNNLLDETDRLIALVEKLELDFLVVDSYQANKEYLEKLNQYISVMYLDDMCMDEYDIAAVLRYGLCGDKKEYLEKYDKYPNVNAIVGIEYTPLRDEFTEDVIMEREKSIMITTGGTDPYDVTGRVLKTCMSDKIFDDYNFEVIVGTMNQFSNELDKMAEDTDRIRLHRNVTNMSYYMRSCEMAVSAGGTTLFEMCACGIPTVCFSFADNQKGGTEDFGRRDIIQCAGDARYVDVVPVIVNRLKELVLDKEKWREYSEKMKKLVDGKGAVRVAERIIKF